AFVPGQLVIRFDNDQDREALINRLGETRDVLRAGGERPGGLTVENVGNSSLVLKIEFSDNVKVRLRNNPQAELDILFELARQIKPNNPSVISAKPNWRPSLHPPGRGSPPRQIRGDVRPMPKGPNDPGYSQQWHYQAPPAGMNAVGAWNASYHGSDKI